MDWNMLKRLLRPAYRKFWVLPRTHRIYKNLSAAETFQRIYATGVWPGGSGSGSQGAAAEYSIDFVSRFIREHGVKTVADLGCGNLNVGRAIIERTGIRYIGVDIVPSLIEAHSHSFPQATFVCANLIADPLPSAELCLVRQVLQHLSNTEIEAVLQNIANYPMALISEQVPLKPRSFNRDKPHGPDVRAYWGSGVYVDRPPFARKIAQSWECELEPGALLRTVLIVS